MIYSGIQHLCTRSFFILMDMSQLYNAFFSKSYNTVLSVPQSQLNQYVILSNIMFIVNIVRELVEKPYLKFIRCECSNNAVYFLYSGMF